MKKLILLLFIPLVSFGQTANEYFNNAIEKITNQDYYGAIADYTKAIELNPNYHYAYKRRGISKNYLEDYYGAIADYTKAIEIDPDFDYAYGSRANAKRALGDSNGYCADMKEAARLGNDDAVKWVADRCN